MSTTVIDIAARFVAWVNNDANAERYTALDFATARLILATSRGRMVLGEMISDAEVPQLVDSSETPIGDVEGGRIEDAGEYLPGARKHMWKPGGAVSTSDLEEIEKQPVGTAVKYITKQYVFGPFPWEDEEEAGTTAAGALYKEKVWRSISKAPALSEEMRRAFVEAGDWLKGQLAKCITHVDVRDLMWRWKDTAKGSELGAKLSPSELLEALDIGFPNPGRSNPDGSRYGSRISITILPDDVRAQTDALRSKKRKLDRKDPDYANQYYEITQEESAIIAEWTVSVFAADWKKLGYYDVLSTSDGSAYWLAKRHEDRAQRDTKLAKYLFALAGVTADDAKIYNRDIAKNPLVKLVMQDDWGAVQEKSHGATWESLLAESPTKKEKGKAWRRATTDQKRVGPDTKRPVNIGDKLITEFQFPGDQFGDWVTQEERAKHREFAWDAFVDLARIVGIPHRMISSCGKLGMAFGARGRGGRAAAHYESVNAVTMKYFPVINLTNTKGDGSLAHEWGHFLDHHMTADPAQLAGGARTMASEMAATAAQRSRSRSNTSNDVRDPRLRKALHEVMVAITEPIETETSQQRIERHFTMRKINSEIERLNHAFSRKEIEHDDYTAKYAEFRREGDKLKRISETSNTSKYLADAELLGAYWCEPCELFARAFESFVEDELANRGEVNTYLVYGTRSPYSHVVTRAGEKQPPVEPYPQGAERAKINAAMRKLVDLLPDSNVLCFDPDKATFLPTPGPTDEVMKDGTVYEHATMNNGAGPRIRRLVISLYPYKEWRKLLAFKGTDYTDDGLARRVWLEAVRADKYGRGRHVPDEIVLDFESWFPFKWLMNSRGLPVLLWGDLEAALKLAEADGWARGEMRVTGTGTNIVSLYCERTDAQGAREDRYYPIGPNPHQIKNWYTLPAHLERLALAELHRMVRGGIDLLHASIEMDGEAYVIMHRPNARAPGTPRPIPLE